MIYTRRHFLRQLLGTGALAATGADSLLAEKVTYPAQGFRFAFVTDLHLMTDPALRSAEGIAACLDAVEKLNPRPEFILVGGDLVNSARDLTIVEAQERLAFFQKLWNDHTSLPCHWVFGNHDLVGTHNGDVSRQDPFFAKGLFQSHFHLSKLYYTYHYKGWRFIVLDDIVLDAEDDYHGEFYAEELAYLRADLDAHPGAPTIICTHVPIFSATAMEIKVARMAGLQINAPKNLTCTNGSAVTSLLPGHNIRAVLCGHLHHYERMDQDGIAYVNSGAVCGNYWKGHVFDCPEGFGVVDLGADGSFKFDYRSYGWKAV